MFILCNSFEVEHEDNRTDSVVIEDCGGYVDELTGYLVVCRQQNIDALFQWAEKNMGSYKAMFEKQFQVSPMKAMSFVKVRNGIHSFTEDMLEEVSDIDEFKSVYCRQLAPAKSFAEPESVPVLQSESIVLPQPESEFVSASHSERGPIPASRSIPESILTQQPALDPVPAQQPEPEAVPVSRIGSPVRKVSVDLSSFGLATQSDASDILHTTEEPACSQHCIYNRDGSFKGFTEGQIVAMLKYLRQLDNRISIGSLDPDGILAEDDMGDAMKLVDSLSPGVLKAFMLNEVMGAESEVDRIRVTRLLDDLATFLQTF